MNKKSLLIALIGGLFLALSVWVSLTYAQEPGPSPDDTGGTGEISSAEALAPDETQALTGRPFSGGPAYDSGWVPVGAGKAVQLFHNLGGSPDNYVVDMQYWAPGDNGVNQRYYGGADFGSQIAVGSPDDRVGAYWRSLDGNSITVYRRPEDTYAEKIRIRIWVDAFPLYNSGWVALPVEGSQTLVHNLGGNPDDYVVDMQYRGGGAGINQRYYGGADFGAKIEIGSPDDRVGAYWRTLTNTSITVFRRAEDMFASEVRIRIWVRPRATYDSGWVNINQNQAIPLNHGLGGDPDDYVVDMQYRAADVNGVNQRYYGGADFGSQIAVGSPDDRVGAYWRALTANSTTVFRRAEDPYAPQVRIRIFRFWTPTRPDYDSGFVNLGTNTALELEHNLGGSTDDYLVDMQYRTQDENGVNQRYYGGADFGANIDIGSPDDRVGAYWRALTNTSITIYRRPEDIYAPRVRIRIWVMPKADYNSGWVAINQNQAIPLLHNLGGDYQGDFLVDFQYKSGGSGVNQRYYGGADFGANIEIGSPDDRMGAYWRSLDVDSITVYRRPEDIYAEQLRVRIWRISPPDYDSGWFTPAVDDPVTLAHNLGGLASGFLVNQYQWDTVDNGLNQRHYGGADFGSQPPSGYAENDRVGSYWRSLNNQAITVYRRPEDGFSDYMRVRIWDLNDRIYIPVIVR